VSLRPLLAAFRSFIAPNRRLKTVPLEVEADIDDRRLLSIFGVRSWHKAVVQQGKKAAFVRPLLSE